MIDYQEALKQILENVSVLKTEDKELTRCGGQLLAEDVYSEHNFPQCEVSIPDGYAVISRDIQNASREKPVTLRILETVRSGYLPLNPVVPGTAVRIMTGSILPEGADCVIRFEDTDEPGNKNGPNLNNPAKVKIYVPGKPGGNIRKPGSDIRKGELLFQQGTLIGPNQISGIAAVGKSKIKVVRRPDMAVIATGDELVTPGYPVALNQVYNANTSALIALINHYGGVPFALGIAHDYQASILTKIRKGFLSDAILLSGGVSRGDFDLVRLMVGQIGRIELSQINLGPGASFAFGLVKRPSNSQQNEMVPVFALSGFPAGCMINFEILVRPALFKMLGYANLEHPSVEAVSLNAVANHRPKGFAYWSRLTREAGEYRVSFNYLAEHSTFKAAGMANSITILPPETSVQEGDRVRVLVLDWCRELQQV